MTHRVSHVSRGAAAAVTAVALLVASCGGGSDDSTESTPADTSAPADDTSTDDTSTDDTDTGDTDTGDTGTDDTDDTGADDTGADSADGSYEPGPVEFRAVNLLDEPVDVYVRTSGFVEAFSVQEGLAPGEVSDVAAPPADGVFLVTEAGGGDPTCVVGCDHFISEITAFTNDGPFHTVVLYEDEFDGPRAFDLWELPTPQTMAASNAMVAADPATGLVVVTAVAVTGIDFGVRLGTDAVDGCVEPVNVEGILIGGSQTPAFDIGAATSITLHDQPDRDCSGDPVGGPFDVEVGPGERLHVFLSGEPGAMDALILPMVDDPTSPPADNSGDDTGDESGDDAADGAPTGDDALAVDLMAEEVVAEFGLDDEAARCTAELLVEALGADVLVVDGALVDLNGLPDEFIEPAGQALFTAVDECGVDPAVFGG